MCKFSGVQVTFFVARRCAAYKMSFSLLLSNAAPSSSSAVLVPATRRSSVGDWAFEVAGPGARNGLPHFVAEYWLLVLVTLSPSRNTLLAYSFRVQIKTCDCTAPSCSGLDRLRRSNSVIIIILHNIFVGCHVTLGYFCWLCMFHHDARSLLDNLRG